MKRSSFVSVLFSIAAVDLSLVHAQSQEVEPCAAVSSAFVEDPAALVDAEVVFRCLASVPIVQKDATDLLDGWAAFLEWQSDPTYKANPPDGYLLPGIDYFQAIADLRDQITSGDITAELDFQEGIRDIVFGANDGHMSFATDFNNAVYWQRSLSIASVSTDGSSIPEVWAIIDVRRFTQDNLSYTPSQIVSIDGQDTAEFLNADYNKVQQVQDPDALYNSQFYNPAKQGDEVSGGFVYPLRYPGPNTTLAFANGSSSVLPNVAGTSRNWEQVIDGPSFYNKFCNATRKMNADESESSDSGTRSGDMEDIGAELVKRQSQRLDPTVVSDDGSFAAYILPGSEEYQRTAAIALHGFTSVNQTQVQELLGQFLGVCRDQGVDHLILDLHSNNGGSIIVSYDIMRQLFPDLYPYFMRSMRAHPQLDVLGERYTNLSIAVLEETEGNRSATLDYDGLAFPDATGYVDRNGDYFPDWPAFYGPVPNNGDEMTEAYTWDVSDTTFSTYYADTGAGLPYYAVTGYGQNAPPPPRTFDPENIVILANGDCSSSCTTLTHFLKWQAKVKTIVMGGRPQTGPMQSPGGIKGGTLAGMLAIVSNARTAYQSSLTPESLIEKGNQTKLAQLLELTDYLSYRTNDPSEDSISVNLANSILADEAANANPDLWAGKELVPLQYLYEAADCRLFYTPSTVLFRLSQWQAAANQAFGFNGTELWSGCVEDSFGHESSLSGDEKLFNGGVPVNVTGFAPANVGDNFVDISVFDTTGNLFVEEDISDDSSSETSSETSPGTATGTANPSQETGNGGQQGVAAQRSVMMVVVALLTGYMAVIV